MRGILCVIVLSFIVGCKPTPTPTPTPAPATGHSEVNNQLPEFKYNPTFRLTSLTTVLDDYTSKPRSVAAPKATAPAEKSPIPTSDPISTPNVPAATPQNVALVKAPNSSPSCTQGGTCDSANQCSNVACGANRGLACGAGGGCGSGDAFMGRGPVRRLVAGRPHVLGRLLGRGCRGGRCGG